MNTEFIKFVENQTIMKQLKINFRTLFLLLVLTSFTFSGCKDPGPTGSTVPSYIKGVKGDKGDKGEKGDKGDDGKDGIDGVNGKDGIDGKDGNDGKDGVNGIDGAKGDKGDKGEDGITQIRVANVSKNNVYRVLTNVNNCNNQGAAGKTLEIYDDVNGNGIADRTEDFLLESFSFCDGDAMTVNFQKYMKIQQYLDIRFENGDIIRNGEVVPDEYFVEIFIDDKLIWDFTAIKRTKIASN